MRTYLPLRLLSIIALSAATILLADEPPAATKRPKSTPPPENFTVKEDIPYCQGRGWLWPALPSNTKTIEVQFYNYRYMKPTRLHAEVLECAHFYVDVPPMKFGGNRIRLQVKDFKPKTPYELDWNFCHLLRITMPETDGEIRGIRAVEFYPPSKTPWYEIPDLPKRTKTINGHVWTEGLSYTGLGRYANSQRAENLTETVFSDSFQVLLTSWDRGNFLIKPDVPEGTTFKEKVDIDYIKRVVTHTGNNGEKLVVTASNAVPGILYESSVPFSINYTGLAKAKVIEGYVGEDTSDFNSGKLKHSLADAAKRKDIACAGYILPERETLVPADELTEGDFDELPAPYIVMLWKLPPAITNAAFWPNAYMAVLVTGHGKFTLGHGSIQLEKGTCGVSSCFNTIVRQNLNIKAIQARSNMLMRVLRCYVVSCKEYYRVTDDYVYIRNEFGHKKWGVPKFQYSPYAVIPPVIAANEPFSTFIELPEGYNRGGSKTNHGPYYLNWKEGSVLNYRLKRIPADHALMPAVPDSDDETQQAQFVLMRTPWQCTGRPYKPYREVFGMGPYSPNITMMNQLLAWGSYDQAARNKLLEFMRIGFSRASMEHLWATRKEHHTGRKYIINGWPADIAGSAGGRYYQGDANTMNSAYWYNVYLYAKYSGDWEFARKQMPFMKALFLYDEMVNSWDNPGPSGRDHIHLTEIDMDTISAMGFCALEKMAHQLGDKDFEDRVAYIRLKSLNCNVAKVVFPYWLFEERPDKIPFAICKGFFANMTSTRLYQKKEGGLDTTTEQTWSNWFGTQPELPLELTRAIKDKYIRQFQMETLPNLFYLWDHAPGPDHGHTWDYIDYVFNSLEVMLNLGLVKEAEEHYDNWLVMISQGEKPFWRPYWKGATLFQNSYIGAVAHIRALKYGFTLRDWEPAVIQTYRLDPATNVVTLSLTSPKPFTIRFHSVKTPQVSGLKSLGNGEYAMDLSAGEQALQIQLR